MLFCFIGKISKLLINIGKNNIYCHPFKIGPLKITNYKLIFDDMNQIKTLKEFFRHFVTNAFWSSKHWSSKINKKSKIFMFWSRIYYWLTLHWFLFSCKKQKPMLFPMFHHLAKHNSIPDQNSELYSILFSLIES